MESMGILGFVFGVSALSFVLKAQGEIATIKEEIETMKKQLKNSDAPKE